MKSFEACEDSDFKRLIDSWVYKRINDGVVDFISLVTSLPGIYPKEIIDSLDRLASKRMIGSDIHLRISKDARTKPAIPLSLEPPNSIPPPHPLDFEWRFIEETIINLVKYCLSLSDSGDTIGLLGVPSLYKLVANNKLNRNFVLFDKNTVDQQITVNYQACISCDILVDKLPDLNSVAKIILTDPPWYLEYQRAFLWNASKICKLDGFLLMVTPKAGTRPEIPKEWQNVLDYSKKLGFKYLGNISDNIIYETPYFEKNALKSVGILNFPKNWRRADLAVFAKNKEKNIPQPSIICTSDWYKESYMGIRVRKHSNSKNFKDPKLVSILLGDVLPSVSRRDPRRGQADVWTSGNRIFTCSGTNVLHQILCAMDVGSSLYVNIESMIGRKLKRREKSLISITKQQIDNIIKLERKELWSI
jgi:hypothetical protein